MSRDGDARFVGGRRWFGVGRDVLVCVAASPVESAMTDYLWQLAASLAVFLFERTHREVAR